MIDMKRLITKCNAPGKPHLVVVNGQWLCMGDHCLGAGDTKPEAFDNRATLKQRTAAMLTQQQAQQTQQTHCDALEVRERYQISFDPRLPWQKSKGWEE